MRNPYVVSVILNTDRKDDTLACLSSIESGSYAPHDIIVLDNASVDGSVEAIAEKFPSVEIIPLAENLGYAGNNNVGIRAGLDKGADWVFILNEDVILAPDAIMELMEVSKRRDDAGILGPLVFHHDEPGIIQSAGGTLNHYWQSKHRSQNEQDTGKYSDPEEVDWISGCAILVKREVFEDVGVLDERFFYYWEETELCLRARRAGWGILFVPHAKIWHKGVQWDYQPSPSITYYWTRNWLLMLAKHRAPIRAWFYAVISIIRNLTTWTLRPKWHSKSDHRDAMLAGVSDFIQRQWGRRII